ncbi:hypothetical protein V8E55_005177 [Tylopilus felleus]
MNYHEFPTERPNEERVANSIAHVVDQHYRPSEQDNQDKNTLRLCLVMPDGQRRSHILTIPRSYATYVLALLYRRFALALLLHHDQTFKIKPYKVWAVLAQNFIHVDNLWEKCIAASDNSKRIDAKTLSTILDRYIVTEAVVKRHEPVYVSEYRRRRTAQMPNVSQATLKDINWATYMDTLKKHQEWSGHNYRYIIPAKRPSRNIVEKILQEARIWYDDTNRPTICEYWSVRCMMSLIMIMAQWIHTLAHGVR